MKNISKLIVTVLLFGSVLSTAVVRAQTDNRIVVRTEDDLPRHTYTISGKSLDVLNDDAKFNALLDQALADTLADLQKYKIEDPATLRAYYDFLQVAYATKGELNLSLEYTEKARALETKQEEKLTRGLALRARIAAIKQVGSEDDPRFDDVFKANLRREVSQLPYEIVKDKLIAVRSTAKMLNRQLVESSLSTQVDPIIEANHGQVPGEIVSALVSTKFALGFGLRAMPLVAEAYGEVIDAHANAKTAADLWTPRLVTLDPAAKAVPVVVGIWDSGVDTSLYPNQLWTNPHEQANGKDNDGNGFIADVHGIAFGEDHRPTTGPLISLAGLKGDKDQLIRFVVASQDMQAGIQNDGVTAFQNYYKSLKGEQLRQFTDDINLIGEYVHGTHVAGIAVAGNPFARIVHVTENWPYKAIPDTAPTIEEGAQWGAETKQAVAYLKQAGARVVNMSWRISRSAFEGMLESKGVGSSAAERAELSRKIFAGLHDGLEEAIRSAPDILFIAGSGNEDNDVDFAEYVPAGLRLPNLITVGAVDDQDKFTVFTTTGKNVQLYANGYRIESFIPGGQRVKFSGTSMAAPQVSNLAAKILALKPEMTPAEVVALMRAHADPVPGQPGRFIINPKKTIAAISE
jgi:subtilisin family serine protease